MTPIDIKDLLPDPDSSTYEKLKLEHPYTILSKYARAIEDKYPGELAGVVTEAVDATRDKLFGYALYILAHIGNGYSYRLLEVEPTSGSMYPLKITVFEKYPRNPTEVNDHVELENALQAIFRSGFVHALLLNLINQVKFYNESRSEKE